MQSSHLEGNRFSAAEERIGGRGLWLAGRRLAAALSALAALSMAVPSPHSLKVVTSCQFAPEAMMRYAVPDSWQAIGVWRWGFHGASHKFIAERSARMLGRDDIGELSPGKRADFAVWRTDVLELGGADDPVAPIKAIEDLENEMRGGGVDYQVVLYGGAVHSFTMPAAGASFS